MRKALLFLTAMMLFLQAAPRAGTAEDDPVSVKAAVDNRTIHIGDRIRYTIEVKAKKGVEVKMPAFGESLGDFSIIDYDTEEGGMFGTRTYRQEYLLDIYETGNYEIPPVKVLYREEGMDEWLEKTTPGITVEVKSLLEAGGATAEGKLRDIRGPVSEFDRRYLMAAAAVIAVAVLAAAAVYFLKNRRRARQRPEPPRPAHESALEALAALSAKKYLERGLYREFYFELSDIVRHYIEDRFSIRAPEMTTEEFLRKMKDAPELDTAHKGMLREFLSHCDMVKFARYAPGSDEAKHSMEAATRFIEETKVPAGTGGTA